MNRDSILALDLGTGSVKALVVDSSCTVLGSSSEVYSVDRPHDGWAEQTPDDWWVSAVTAARRAVDAAGSPPIVAIGISGQMHGTVLVDEDGEVVRPAIIWEDRRSARQVDRLTRRIGAERIIQMCGSPLATGFQAATLAWLVEHEPEAIRKTATVLLPGDYLRFRMTGIRTTEPSGASSTLLFDIHRRTWSSDLLETLGIVDERLPAVLESTTVHGRLTPNAARQLGLEPGIPVTGGGGDAPLAALAAGVADADTLLLTISTGSQAILPVGSAAVDPRGRIHTWCHVAPPGSEMPGWYQMGATLASGRAVRWFAETILGGSATDIDELAGAVPPGSNGIVFLPYLNGERTPHMDPDAAGAFLGLRASHEPADLARAVLEGTMLALRDAFAVLEELGGSPSRIVLAGGGARSTTWSRICADLFDLPVDPLQESEGSAMGAAIVAGRAIGWFDLSTGASLAAIFASRIEPEPNAVAIYRDIRPIFSHAYLALREDLHRLGQIAVRARSASISA